MSAYQTFTTARATPPDPVALLAAVKTATSDPTAVLQDARDGTWRGKKATTWLPAEIAATQTALDTTPAVTPQLAAQRAIDIWSIEIRGLLLTLLDEINLLRTEINVLRAAVVPPLTPPLPLRTPAQAIAASRAKAGTLS